ncbi:hypothetical protein LJC61_09460 [Ruminococcaceae bacterium OttesenSCG-928-A16]|nr:hypothetical protein [Ruminococcaceae bacterium OttesenSCG-928-A16]
MKRIVAALVAVGLCLCLAACGEKDAFSVYQKYISKYSPIYFLDKNPEYVENVELRNKAEQVALDTTQEYFDRMDALILLVELDLLAQEEEVEPQYPISAKAATALLQQADFADDQIWSYLSGRHWSAKYWLQAGLAGLQENQLVELAAMSTKVRFDRKELYYAELDAYLQKNPQQVANVLPKLVEEDFFAEERYEELQRCMQLVIDQTAGGEDTYLALKDIYNNILPLLPGHCGEDMEEWFSDKGDYTLGLTVAINPEEMVFPDLLQQWQQNPDDWGLPMSSPETLYEQKGAVEPGSILAVRYSLPLDREPLNPPPVLQINADWMMMLPPRLWPASLQQADYLWADNVYYFSTGPYAGIASKEKLEGEVIGYASQSVTALYSLNNMQLLQRRYAMLTYPPTTILIEGTENMDVYAKTASASEALKYFDLTDW